MHVCESCDSYRVTLQDYGTHYVVKCNQCHAYGKPFTAPLAVNRKKDE